MKTVKNKVVQYGIAFSAALCSIISPAFAYPQEAVMQGNRLVDQGRYEEALSCFKQAAQDELSDKQLIGLSLSNAGECCRKLHRFSEAKKFFQQAYDYLQHSGKGVGNRDVNTLLVRYSLCFIAEQNYGRAESLLKQCLENSLGIWTFNYTDLPGSAGYIQMLVSVTNAKDGTGSRWYAHGEQELKRLVVIPGQVGSMAQMALARLRSYEQQFGGVPVATQPPPPSVQPHSRDPYFSGSTGYQHRIHYGLNGTEFQFSQPAWRIN